MEDYIIISTEYYWHWDLKGTGLDVWQYRKIMEKMMAAGGLEPAATDDPEICSHPANCLMVRDRKTRRPGIDRTIQSTSFSASLYVLNQHEYHDKGDHNAR